MGSLIQLQSPAIPSSLGFLPSGLGGWAPLGRGRGEVPLPVWVPLSSPLCQKMKGAGLPGELIFSLQSDQLPGHPGTERPLRHTLQALRKSDVGHANHESLVSTRSSRVCCPPGVVPARPLSIFVFPVDAWNPTIYIGPAFRETLTPRFLFFFPKVEKLMNAMDITSCTKRFANNLRSFRTSHPMAPTHRHQVKNTGWSLLTSFKVFLPLKELSQCFL